MTILLSPSDRSIIHWGPDKEADFFLTAMSAATQVGSAAREGPHDPRAPCSSRCTGFRRVARTPPPRSDTWRTQQAGARHLPGATRVARRVSREQGARCTRAAQALTSGFLRSGAELRDRWAMSDTCRTRQAGEGPPRATRVARGGAARAACLPGPTRVACRGAARGYLPGTTRVARGGRGARAGHPPGAPRFARAMRRDATRERHASRAGGGGDGAEVGWRARRASAGGLRAAVPPGERRLKRQGASARFAGARKEPGGAIRAPGGGSGFENRSCAWLTKGRRESARRDYIAPPSTREANIPNERTA